MSSRRPFIRRASLFVAGASLASGPAAACIVSVQTKPEDIRYADLVVVGRISNYRIIRDEAFRKRMLSNPRLPPADRELYRGRGPLMSDHARFDVTITETLVGSSPARIAVTWDNSTFGEPQMLPTGPFLIALRRQSSAGPPLRGPSATIAPSREHAAPTVLQAPCAGPFLFPVASDMARGVRALLTRRR